eukprot:UN21123
MFYDSCYSWMTDSEEVDHVAVSPIFVMEFIIFFRYININLN